MISFFLLSFSLPKQRLNIILSPSSASWLVYLDVTAEISYTLNACKGQSLRLVTSEVSGIQKSVCLIQSHSCVTGSLSAKFRLTISLLMFTMWLFWNRWEGFAK